MLGLPATKALSTLAIGSSLAFALSPPPLPAIDSSAAAPYPTGLDGFVSSRDGHLYVQERLLDFRSMNAPNLLAGNNFTIRDTFQTIAALGAPVTRTYVVASVQNDMFGGNSNSNSFIRGWNATANDWTYNDYRLVVMDYVLAMAAEYGIKLIIPLINQDYGTESTDWVGNFNDMIRHRYGISNYTVAQETVDFFVDTEMRIATKSLITKILTRKNTINGKIYGSDDVVLAWETGNEMNWGSANNTIHRRPAPANWTIDIARTMKALSPNTLVMDGSFARNYNVSQVWPEETLKAPEVDLFSYHLYGDGDIAYFSQLNDVVRAAGKTFIVGEHGFYSSAGAFGQAISTFQCAGSMVWSMRPHSELGGFLTHSEGSGVYSYHFPGWANQTDANFDPYELPIIQATYNSSFTALSQPVPSYPVPGSPTLFANLNGTYNNQTTPGIWFQGSAWGEHYELWSARADAQGFKRVNGKILDNVNAGTLFIPVHPTNATASISTATPLHHNTGHEIWVDTKWGNSKRSVWRATHGGGARHIRGQHPRQQGSYKASGSWYVVRAISVDGVAGPFSNSVYIEV